MGMLSGDNCFIEVKEGRAVYLSQFNFEGMIF